MKSMKFGQGVYWGDGGWRTQIIGVMGGKRVAGLGGLGEWVGGGRLTAGGGRLRAGHARPLRGGGRVSGCWPEGARVWGGFWPSFTYSSSISRVRFS